MSMSDPTGEMRTLAKKLLESGDVDTIIGWEKGSLWYQSPPVFITRAEDADRLVFDDFAINSLVTYLLDERDSDKKIGVFVKGCDSRGLVRILQDQQFPRERVYVIGLPCSGKKDPKQAQNKSAQDSDQVPLAVKCQECIYPNPVISDVTIGDAVEAKPAVEDRFATVKEIEAKTADEKYALWSSEYSKCLRCFACRNVCPACNCRDCTFDNCRPRILEKENTTMQNFVYHLTRAFHVAGRCVECGECERVCPVGVSIMDLNKKIIKEIDTIFGPYEAGVKLDDTPPPLGTYKTEDPEEFM
jgi:formate dehydrogenase subunit beta